MKHVNLELVDTLIVSETLGDFDARGVPPHKYLPSLITSENHENFATVLIEVVELHSNKKDFEKVLNTVARVLYHSHKLEFFDRRRIARSLIEQSYSTATNPAIQGAFLNCLNALEIELDRLDISQYEPNSKCYSFQWCKALSQCEEYKEMAQSLLDFIEGGVVKRHEIPRYLHFLGKSIELTNRNRFNEAIGVLSSLAAGAELESDPDNGTPIVTSMLIVRNSKKDRSGWKVEGS